jgi:hypothetical protein
VERRDFQCWCFNCLAWGHGSRSCSSQVRCRMCYNYGHISRSCPVRRWAKTYRRKPPAAAASGSFKPHPAQENPSFTSPLPASTSPLSPATAEEHSERLATMTNNPVDPRPLVPRGFIICNRSQEEATTQRAFAFLTTSVRHINEDVAIAVLAPALDLMDFHLASDAIHSFLVNDLRLHVVEIGPSALGAATITFTSCLDRQIAMTGPHRMDNYWLTFTPHDAGPNLRHLALDRTGWIMLVNFPLDCLSEHCIAAAINSFGNLLHWHESSNKAHQIILVNLHSSPRIPFSLVVTVGDKPYARCWSVTCFLLIEA